MGFYKPKIIPTYTGSTTVTPSNANQTLATANKMVTSDILVNKVTNLTSSRVKRNTIIANVVGALRYVDIQNYPVTNGGAFPARMSSNLYDAYAATSGTQIYQISLTVDSAADAYPVSIYGLFATDNDTDYGCGIIAENSYIHVRQLYGSNLIHYILRFNSVTPVGTYTSMLVTTYVAWSGSGAGMPASPSLTFKAAFMV